MKRWMADETKAAYYSAEDQWNDRSMFVINLGWLLMQTREGVSFLELTRDDDGTETVNIWYKNGYKREVDVTCNSYAAIVKDVVKHI